MTLYIDTMHKAPGPIHGFLATLLPAMGQYEFISKDANWFNGPIDRDYACLLWAHLRLSSGSSLSRTLRFAFIFGVIIIRYDKVARDHGIVHMIVTRANSIT